MIVLDTNVVSELMRARPAEFVVLFFGGQPADLMVTTSITIAEILYGVRRLPKGRRRSELEDGLEEFLARGFREKVLSFDAGAADRYSQLIVDRQRVGRRIEPFDAMIAAIALCNGAAIATRDVADFEDCGVALINPWD